MRLARKVTLIALRTIPFLLLFAVFALVFHYQLEGLSSATAISSGAKNKLKSIRLQHEDRIDLGLTGRWRGELSLLDPTFLRVDYKQNLSVWPVVAGKLIRSPPSLAIL